MRTGTIPHSNSTYTKAIGSKGLKSRVRGTGPLGFKSIEPDYEQIPACLRARKQWLPWRIEYRHGKPSKVPLDPQTDSRARWSNPGVLVSFREALAYCKQHDAVGLGFFFLNSDPYVGIDLDSCRTADGTVRPWAQRIIDDFASYAEVSPSGTGVKLILRATKPAWSGCKVPKDYIEKLRPTSPTKAVEIALTDSRGYFALTGHVYRYGAVQERTQQLELFCKRYWSDDENTSCALERKLRVHGLSKSMKLELNRRLSNADLAPSHNNVGDQSRHDFSLICWLLREGVDPESVWPELRHHSKFARRGRKYFETTVANARKTPGVMPV